ncbi:MAG: M48 family metallopeptidase [Planctomycetes bacterium]|nr:M48 family metallopeptidase [Planctomycetota bacterium]
MTSADEQLRAKLALIFVPGLYACLLLSALISVAIAAALIALVAWIGYLTGYRMAGPVALLAIGGIAGIIISLRAGFKTIQRARITVIGLPLQERDAPRLFKLLRRMSQALNCDLPDHVIVELDSNFFVTEAKVICIDRPRRGRTLVLSAPLLRLLSIKELCAVLAHEMAHFSGADTAYSCRFYPIYRGTSSAIEDIERIFGSEREDSGIVAIPLLIPYFLLNWYLNFFALREASISRARELRADRLAAKITSPRVMASALIKVHAYCVLWSRAMDSWIIKYVETRKSVANLSRLFCQSVSHEVKRESGRVIELARSCDILWHPTDSHPSLDSRLTYLGETGSALALGDQQTASQLVPSLDKFERELTEIKGHLTAQVVMAQAEASASKRVSLGWRLGRAIRRFLHRSPSGTSV